MDIHGFQRTFRPRASVIPLARAKSRLASGYRMATKADSGEIWLYGMIGSAGFWGDGSEVSADQFRKDLSAMGAVRTIDVHIKSEGGDVFDGMAMYSLLKNHPANVAVHIDGLAASAASYVAMAGDSIEIAEGAFMMIHNAWTISVGNAADIRKSADRLDAIDGSMADIYAARTGLPVDEIKTMMAAETWMNGSECKAKGFADNVSPNKAIAASVRYLDFRNTPTALRPNREAATRQVAAMRRRLAAVKP